MSGSVCIAARNEASCIAATIESIRKQCYPLSEILVCANGCSDATEAIVEELAEADDRIRLISNHTVGKASAWNRLIREAVSDTIFFVDADVVLESRALSNLAALLDAEQSLLLAAGTPRPVVRKGKFWQWLTAPPPAPPGIVVGRLYATRRDRLLPAMRAQGYSEMPSDIIAEDLWLTCLVGHRRWRPVADSVVWYTWPTVHDQLVTARREWRALNQLRRRYPDMADVLSSSFLTRLRRHLRAMLSAPDLFRATRIVVRFLYCQAIKPRLPMSKKRARALDCRWLVARSSKVVLPHRELGQCRAGGAT